MKNIRQKFIEMFSYDKKKHYLAQIAVFLLFIISSGASLMAQGFVVNGKVLDANDEPLIGAAIVLKSQSTTGTIIYY